MCHVLAPNRINENEYGTVSEVTCLTAHLQLVLELNIIELHCTI
jgi:hypothetical protein